jgi:tRNA pseudouridine32 synthase/23S rRNA pseudouridine746 synthase
MVFIIANDRGPGPRRGTIPYALPVPDQQPAQQPDQHHSPHPESATPPGSTPEPGPARVHTPPTPGLDITVVHADERFVVISKPAGMLSVPGRGEDKQDCARVRVQQRFPDATGSMTCHRLDMDTSGLLVMGLDPEAHRKLSGQFEKRRVRKWYTALCEGQLPEHPLPGETEGDQRRGVVEFPQCVDWPNRPLQKVDAENGKPGKTNWILREEETWTTPDGRTIEATRLELRPITGRTHQLRLHCAHGLVRTDPGHAGEPGGLGIPIIGDRLYGDDSLAPRLLLHAERLGFWHPFNGDWMLFEDPAPF